MGKREWVQTEIEEISFKHRKKCFHHKGNESLEQVAQRGRFSSCGDTQNLAIHDPWQSAVADPALSSMVEQYGLQRSLPAVKTLWFYELWMLNYFFFHCHMEKHFKGLRIQASQLRI